MLRAGDVVYISGTVFGARDAAHKKMSDLIASGCDLPFDIRGRSFIMLDRVLPGQEWS